MHTTSSTRPAADHLGIAGGAPVIPSTRASSSGSDTPPRGDLKHDPVDATPLRVRGVRSSATRRVDQSADRAFQALRRVVTCPQPYRRPGVGDLVVHALACVARAGRLPTGDEARHLARALEYAGAADLSRASEALEDYLAQTLSPQQLASEPAHHLVRQVFISLWRSPDQRPGDLALGLLARCPRCASVALEALFVAALQVPEHVTVAVLGLVRENLLDFLHPETSGQQLLDALSAALRTTCRRAFRSLEPASLSIPAGRLAGLPEPAGVEKEVLGWAMELMAVCELRGLSLTGGHGLRLAPAVQEVVAGMQTLSVARVRSLLGALTITLDLDSLQLVPRYSVPRLLQELPPTATWMPVLGAVQAGAAAFTRMAPAGDPSAWPWKQAMAILDRVPPGMRLGALAAIFQVHAGLDLVKSLGGMASSTCLQTLAAHAAQFTDVELACAALGVELLASLGLYPGDGKSTDARWQAVLASGQLPPSQEGRLRQARDVVGAWVADSSTLAAYPGLTSSERLQLLSIIHLGQLLEDPSRTQATVASLCLLEGLGSLRAALLVMAALDRQTGLSVEAFAQVHAALVDRVVAGPDRSRGPTEGKQGAHPGFAGGRPARKMPDDDDAAMQQALGGWRIQAMGAGITQPLADVRSFHDNLVESCGLLPLCRLPAHEVHPDDIRAHRPRIVHVLRLLDAAASQVRVSLADDRPAQRYLLEPLSQLDGALRATLERIGAPWKSPVPVRGPDPDKPATR